MNIALSAVGDELVLRHLHSRATGQLHRKCFSTVPKIHAVLETEVARGNSSGVRVFV